MHQRGADLHPPEQGQAQEQQAPHPSSVSAGEGVSSEQEVLAAYTEVVLQLMPLMAAMEAGDLGALAKAESLCRGLDQGIAG